MSEWNDLKKISNEYKSLISKYFNHYNGKYIIENNILIVDFENWGLEKFYINGIVNKKKFYFIQYENISKIYDIAISIQIGNWNVFKLMEPYLENFNKINVNFYFVLINIHAIPENIEYLKNKYKTSVILSAENRGMDIGLFFISLYYIKINKFNHDYIIKIHTKTNNNFRNECLNNIMGSENKIINNIKKISKEDVGIISGNVIYKYNEYKDPFTCNYYHLEKLVKYLYNESIKYENLEFSAGTMFMAKMKIFSILNIQNIDYIYNNLNNIDTLDYYWYSINYNLNINNKKKIFNDYYNNKNNRFPNNIAYSIKTGKPGLRDYMIEHAVERLLGYLCKKNNLSLIR
jgi:hypothetical protein